VNQKTIAEAINLSQIRKLFYQAAEKIKEVKITRAFVYRKEVYYLPQ